jgi:hypothetical protein
MADWRPVLPVRSADCCGRLAAKETFAAIHRPALGGFEGDGGLPAALGTHRHGFRLRKSRARRTLALGLAVLAALRFVLEVFVMEEVLFSRCKNEITTAVYALENSILKIRHTN